MKIIHGGGYTDREREAYRDIIHDNIITAMQVLYDALAVFDVAISSPELAQEAAEWFDALNPTVTTAPLDLFGRMWADAGVQEVYSRRHLLQLSDGAAHYMESLGRLADPKWVPTDKDVLHARLPTRGVHEYVFGTKVRRCPFSCCTHPGCPPTHTSPPSRISTTNWPAGYLALADQINRA
jgi:hypothetical protein